MELSRRIQACATLAELGQLLQRCRGQLGRHHYSVAFMLSIRLGSWRQAGPGHALGAGREEEGGGGQAPGVGSAREEGPALALAAELFGEHMGQMGGRELSNALHAMVKARHEPANGLQGRVLAALLADRGAGLLKEKAQSVSLTLWALARLHRDGGERFDPADVAALARMASGKLRDPDTIPQDLTKVAWALAVLGHEDRAFMGELLSEVQAHLPAFKPQALSDILQAASSPGQPLPPGFLGAFLAAAGAQLPAFKPQALSSTLRAAATLGQPLPPRFLAASLAAAEAQLTSSEPQHLSSTVWALATLALDVGGGGSCSLVELLDQPTSDQQIGWPKAQLQCFLGALAGEAAQRLSHGSSAAAGWKAQELANTIWAFSQLRHFHAGLWAAVTGEALARCGLSEDRGWAGPDVSNLALGLARLRAGTGGAPDPALVPLLTRMGSRLAADRPTAFSAQQACNLAWAHAAAGAPYCAWLMEGLVLPLAYNLDSLAPEEKQQLLQYLLAMERPGSGMPLAVAQRPEYRSLRQLGVEAHQARVQDRSRQAPSQLQRGVHAAAQRLAAQGVLVSAGLEQRTPSGLFSVDVAVVLPGGRCVAVEVDGPTHFSSHCDADGRPVAVAAATLLRDRLLPAVEPGWAVASVPFHEWYALGGDAGAEERCLVRLLGLKGGTARSKAGPKARAAKAEVPVAVPEPGSSSSSSVPAPAPPAAAEAGPGQQPGEQRGRGRPKGSKNKAKPGEAVPEPGGSSSSSSSVSVPAPAPPAAPGAGPGQQPGVQRGRGRPKGSKNKAKPDDNSSSSSAEQAA
jgi:hypothetical protein